MPPISTVYLFSSSIYAGRQEGINAELARNSAPEKPDNLHWFTQEMWETICPYAKVSAVFAHDGEPFWRYSDFISAIAWMNRHQTKMFHNFGTDSKDININKFEIAAFLGNFTQETGWKLLAPYPYSYPPIAKRGEVWEGYSGGGLAILEGVTGELYFDVPPTYPVEMVSKPLKLSSTEKKVLGVPENSIGGIARSLKQINQPQFGLGRGTGGGATFQDGLVSVSDDGTLWGDKPLDEKVGKVRPSSEHRQILDDRTYSSLGPSSQYGGRGAIQLSYNYNYSDCSMALFGDYRLAKYPNLIVTTDRESFNRKPFTFGFPGPNPGGDNQLPQWIKESTPPARQLAFITCFWFWMDNNRSGRKISCHECMLKLKTHGICAANLIINNQDGLSVSWAADKLNYYRRICRILRLTDIESTIVKPPKELYQ
jgi:hypothetical protein